MKKYIVQLNNKLNSELELMYTDFCNDSLEDGCERYSLPSFEEFITFVLAWYTDGKK